MMPADAMLMCLLVTVGVLVLEHRAKKRAEPKIHCGDTTCEDDHG